MNKIRRQMIKQSGLHPDNFKILSDNCIEIEDNLYLIKTERPDDIITLFLYCEGTSTAKMVIEEKMRKEAGTSMDNIKNLFYDSYYMQRLITAISQYEK